MVDFPAYLIWEGVSEHLLTGLLLWFMLGLFTALLLGFFTRKDVPKDTRRRMVHQPVVCYYCGTTTALRVPKGWEKLARESWKRKHQQQCRTINTKEKT